MRLSNSEWKAISNLTANFSAVFLASLIVPFFAEFDFLKWPVLLSGGVLTSLFSFLSIFTARKGKL